MHSNLPLVRASHHGVAYDKAAIMRRAYQHGRFALQLSRARREPAAERFRIPSRALTKAWAEAKQEAVSLRRHAEQAEASRAALAERARESVALASHYGSTDAIREAIQSEHYRDRMNFAAVDRLEAALSHIGA
jgi:hypothetical protein